MAGPAAISIRRTRPARLVISLVPMIDVLLILLVFFMVTSTYLDLDMLALTPGDGTAGATAPSPATTAAPLIVRISAGGEISVQGRALTPGAFTETLAARLGEIPDLEILLLPSGAAGVQALVTATDLAAEAGARRIRLLRLEARP